MDIGYQTFPLLQSFLMFFFTLCTSELKRYVVQQQNFRTAVNLILAHSQR